LTDRGFRVPSCSHWFLRCSYVWSKRMLRASDVGFERAWRFLKGCAEEGKLVVVVPRFWVCLPLALGNPRAFMHGNPGGPMDSRAFPRGTVHTVPHRPILPTPPRPIRTPRVVVMGVHRNCAFCITYQRRHSTVAGPSHCRPSQCNGAGQVDCLALDAPQRFERHSEGGIALRVDV
jgi:hypothetical protein